MGYKSLMTVHSALAVPMGIACIGMPSRLLANYGLSLSPMGLVIYQFWGVSMVGLGALTWILRESRETQIQARTSLALAFIHLLNCMVAVRGQSAGSNGFGWTTVGLFLLLAVGFAYVRFKMVLAVVNRPGSTGDRLT